MANCASHLVDRVVPDVPVRQYVLSLPHELRRLAAFKQDVLGAFVRIFMETVSSRYRAEGAAPPRRPFPPHLTLRPSPTRETGQIRRDPSKGEAFGEHPAASAPARDRQLQGFRRSLSGGKWCHNCQSGLPT
jgi:hypothetical protein